MLKFTSVLLVLFLGGCAIGPFEIYHKEGSLPKGRINISDECKVRGRANMGKSNMRVACKWYIDSMFSFTDKK
jgi:hypothetical protein